LRLRPLGYLVGVFVILFIGASCSIEIFTIIDDDDDDRDDEF
jgi:hypothetical protein